MKKRGKVLKSNPWKTRVGGLAKLKIANVTWQGIKQKMHTTVYVVGKKYDENHNKNN